MSESACLDQGLSVTSQVFGWVYFVAWSASFYPQLYENWRRKSVVGYSLDFITLNLTGFVCYAAYNVCLFWIPSIQREYSALHGEIPVKINDVVFALHALVMCALTAVQCIIYDRGPQKVALPVIVASCLAWVSIIAVFLVVFSGQQQALSYLFFLNYLSYVKVGVTFCKYVPQAWLNFRRKSTVGWHIGNVLMDLCGGVFSFAQLFVDSVCVGNYNGFTGDAAKTLLSVLSVAFDILFMLQHYVCYRKSRTAKPKRALYVVSDGDILSSASESEAKPNV